MIKTTALFLCAGIFAGCQNAGGQLTTEETPAKPKNIILLIGDGMGLSQVSASFYFNDQKTNFYRFPQVGLHQSSASSHKITDSAAGATAFASGEKSYNGAIGVNKDTVAIATIVELASKKGISSGVVSTSSITHATPASFYAHVKSRGMAEEIAEYLVASPIDFFAGGGLDYFAKRKDGSNYLDSLANQGFAVNTTALNRPQNLSIDNKYGFLLADDGMPRMVDGRGSFLPDATAMALDHLSQDEDGFFLMIEGSQIDWGGHANDSEYLISEQLDFDQTIGLALDFAEKNGNTLVIVTADHETGGLTLSSTPLEGGGADYNKITPTFSTGGHSATLIPVFSFGPGSENFSGIYQNNDIFEKMKSAAGW